MPKGLNFGLKQSFLHRGIIEIGKLFVQYCSPLEPTKAFVCICVDLFYTIYVNCVLVLGVTISGSPKPRAEVCENVITPN